jgi:hypothetical protein
MAKGTKGLGNEEAEGEEDAAAIRRDASYMSTSTEASSARSSKDGSTLSTSIEAPSNVSAETTPWDAPSRESRAAGTGAGVDGPDSWPEAKQVESSTLESNESGFVDKARLLRNIDTAMAARGQSAERDGGAAGIDSGGGEQSRSDAAAMEKTSPDERGARAVNAPEKPPVEEYSDRDPARGEFVDRDPARVVKEVGAGEYQEAGNFKPEAVSRDAARYGKIADAPEASAEANQPAGGFHITAQPGAAGLGSDQPAQFDEWANGQRGVNKGVEEWRGDAAKTQEAMSPEEKAAQASAVHGTDGAGDAYVERDPARYGKAADIDGSTVTAQSSGNSASNEQGAQQAEVKQQEQPDVSREGRQLDARSREDARGR